MKNKNLKKLKILIICISITFCIMIFKKWNYIKNSGIRNLNEQQQYINYVCNKAGKSLTKKYSNGFDEKIYETKKPNKAQKAIIDLLRYSEIKYIKNYIPRIAVFIAFLILDILFIFFWISYCCCCCCNCCFFKKATPPSNRKRFLYFLLSSFFNIFVIILSIVILLLINPFIKKLNGIACSSLTLVDHFRDGTNGSYTEVSYRWDGFLGIQKLLNDTNNKYNEIIYDKELNENIEYAKSNYSSLSRDTCGIKKVIEKDVFEKEIKDFYQSTNNLFNSTNYNEEIENLNKAYDKFTKIEKDACKNVYTAYHDYINKNVKKALIIYFTIPLSFGLLGLIFLILYYYLKSNIFRIIYVLIWNISMILIFLSILISVIFGLVGFISEDIIRVFQYIFSKDNLDHADPLFINSNSFVSNLVYRCINGDENILSGIIEKEELEKYIKNINQNSDKYINIINLLNQYKCNEKEEIARKSIKKVYDLLLEKNIQLVNISLSLTLNNITCIFAKNDEMIILREISSTSKNEISICSFSFLIGIAFSLSILAGILFVYKYKDEIEVSANEVTKANESDIHIND